MVYSYVYTVYGILLNRVQVFEIFADDAQKEKEQKYIDSIKDEPKTDEKQVEITRDKTDEIQVESKEANETKVQTIEKVKADKDKDEDKDKDKDENENENETENNIEELYQSLDDIVTDNKIWKSMKSNIKVYGFSCCSSISETQIILGVELSKYYRTKIRCRDCGTNTCCDTCIGMTSNGYYDVDKIHNKPVTVNLDHMCLYCGFDNKTDMCFKNDEGKEIRIPCKNCFRARQHKSDSKLTSLKYNNNAEFNDIKKITKLLKSDLLEPAVYYMIDDCLSCT
jgi:hypothetical protein